MSKAVDYTIVSEPSYIKVECPHCHDDVEIDFDSIDFETDYWGDGGRCDCPICEKEIELGDYEYA